MGFDVLFGAVVFFGAWRGFCRGFAFTAILATGAVFGILFAQPISERLANVAAGHLSWAPEALHPSLVYLGAILLLWGAVIGGGAFYLAVYRRIMMGNGNPSPEDRLFGVAAGAAVACFWVCVLGLVVDSLPQAIKDYPVVKEHYDASQGVKLVHQFGDLRPVLQIREVRRARDHIHQVVRYYTTGQTGDAGPVTGQSEATGWEGLK